jgi:hypothetical protein
MDVLYQCARISSTFTVGIGSATYTAHWRTFFVIAKRAGILNVTHAIRVSVTSVTTCNKTANTIQYLLDIGT